MTTSTRPAERAFRAILLLAPLLLVPIACEPSEPALRNAAEVQAIDALRERLVEASRAGDAASVSRLFAEDGVFLPPGQQPLSGRPAIRQWWGSADTGGLAWNEVESFEIVVAGDWAFDRGAYAASTPGPSADDEGDATKERVHGNYLHVLRRQEDGSWKIARALWNRLPALALEDIPRVPRTP